MHREHFKLMDFALRKELMELYVSMGLRSLALSSIGIFVPLYLYKELGFGFGKVLYFYLIFCLFFALFSVFSGYLVSKIGVKYLILISSFLHVFYFVFLYLLKFGYFNYFWVAGFIGFVNALFWIGFHSGFGSVSDGIYRDEEIGVLYCIAIVIGLLGPLVGGLLLEFFSFGVLFLIVGVLLLLSVLPLFFSKEFFRYKFNISKIFSRRRVRDVLGYVGYGIEGMGIGVLWPIFVFLILKKYLIIGILSSVIGLVIGGFNIIVGKLSFKIGKDKLIRIGVFLNSFSWFIRFLMRDVFRIFLITFLGRLSFVLIDIPFSAKTYDRSKKVEDFVFREICLCLGRGILLFGVLIGNLFLGVDGGLIVGFFIVGFGSLLCLVF